MSWNNRNSFGNFQRNNGGGWAQAPYRQNYGGGYNQPSRFNQDSFRQRPQKKHSGAKSGYAHGDQSRPYIRGWKFDKTHGLRAFICSPNKKTKDVTSKNGKTWANWTAKVTTPNGVQLYNCLYNYETKTVFINDLGLILRPSSPNGGYVGPFFKRKNR